jgi:hypothetical protein
MPNKTSIWRKNRNGWLRIAKRYLAIASLKLRRVWVGEQFGVRLRAMVRERGDRGPR